MVDQSIRRKAVELVPMDDTYMPAHHIPHVVYHAYLPTPTKPRTHLLELRLLRNPGGARERDAVLVDAEELVDHGLVRPLRQTACG